MQPRMMQDNFYWLFEVHQNDQSCPGTQPPTHILTEKVTYRGKNAALKMLWPKDVTGMLASKNKKKIMEKVKGVIITNQNAPISPTKNPL